VRGEGGVLKIIPESDSCLMIFPKNYRSQTSTDEQEGWRYIRETKKCQATARTFFTRDHVARCIMREIKAGRGSPHGGVFLTSHGSGKDFQCSPINIRKKLPRHVPSILGVGGCDITKRSDGGGSHYSLYDGWNKVEPFTMTTVLVFLPPANAPLVLHGANRLGGNSLSDY